MRAGALQDLTLNATRIKGMRQAGIDPRLLHDAEGSSGRLHIHKHHYLHTAPLIRGNTRDYAAMHSLFGGNADTPSAALTNILGTVAAGNPDAPGFLGSATSTRVTGTKGHGFIRTITIEASGKVEVSFDAYLLSANGSALPYTETEVVRTVDDGEIDPHVLAALTIGGVDAMAGFRRLTIECNHGAENNVPGSSYNGGLAHPVAMAMPGAHGPIEIVATLMTQNIALRPSTGVLALQLAPLISGGFQGAATHAIALNGIVDPLQGHDASQGGPAEKTIVCRGFQNGATLPLTMSAL